MSYHFWLHCTDHTILCHWHTKLCYILTHYTSSLAHYIYYFSNTLYTIMSLVHYSMSLAHYGMSLIIVYHWHTKVHHSRCCPICYIQSTSSTSKPDPFPRGHSLLGWKLHIEFDCLWEYTHHHENSLLQHFPPKKVGQEKNQTNSLRKMYIYFSCHAKHLILRYKCWVRGLHNILHHSNTPKKHFNVSKMKNVAHNCFRKWPTWSEKKICLALLSNTCIRSWPSCCNRNFNGSKYTDSKHYWPWVTLNCTYGPLCTENVKVANYLKLHCS